MTVNRGAFMDNETFLEKQYEVLVQTAALTLGGDAAKESWALVTAINTRLTAIGGHDLLPTTKRMKLTGILNVIQIAASADLVNWGDGDIDIDTDARAYAYTTPAAAATYPQEVELITDETGNVEVKVALKANVTLDFICKRAVEIQTIAE